MSDKQFACSLAPSLLTDEFHYLEEGSRKWMAAMMAAAWEVAKAEGFLGKDEFFPEPNEIEVAESVNGGYVVRVAWPEAGDTEKVRFKRMLEGGNDGQTN